MNGIQPIYPLPEENCSICADALEENVVDIIMCQHSFHTMCLLTWLSATDGTRNRACPNCRVCLFDQTNPGPYIAPDPRPGTVPEPPEIVDSYQTFLRGEHQRVAELRAAGLRPAPAPRPIPEPIPQDNTFVLLSQDELDLLTPEEQAAFFYTRDITPIDYHTSMRASRTQGNSRPNNRRTQAPIRPARPRRPRLSRSNHGHVDPIVAMDDFDDNPQAEVPDPVRELDSREIRLARRVRRREEAETAAALRRRG